MWTCAHAWVQIMSLLQHISIQLLWQMGYGYISDYPFLSQNKIFRRKDLSILTFINKYLPSYISVNGDQNTSQYSAYVRLKSMEPSCRWRLIFGLLSNWYMYLKVNLSKLTYLTLSHNLAMPTQIIIYCVFCNILGPRVILYFFI